MCVKSPNKSSRFTILPSLTPSSSVTAMKSAEQTLNTSYRTSHFLLLSNSWIMFRIKHNRQSCVILNHIGLIMSSGDIGTHCCQDTWFLKNHSGHCSVLKSVLTHFAHIHEGRGAERRERHERGTDQNACRSSCGRL